MSKVELSLALSSRGRSTLSTPLEKHLIALCEVLQTMKMTRTPGIYSASLGKAWVSDGADRSEITVTLSFRVEPSPSSAKQAAVAAAFS
jgi:hypothetical protein